jgi:hypothetical protein
MIQIVNRALVGLFVAFALCLGLVATGYAQDAEPQPTGQLGQLYITGSNADSFPSVQLRVYGLDGQGNPIDFASEPLYIAHNSFPADEISFDGKVPVGTLTVFLIDATADVSSQLPAIQDAIRQYAAAGNMQEQLDHVAIYQIDSDGPRQLLAPTPFYNGVGNLFTTTPLAAEMDATSLYDSVIRMIEEVPALKPNPDMAASIVLFGDGTDPGTSQAQPGDVPLRAAAAGIPIHTILLDNPNLGVGKELGRQYFQDVATGARGVATELGNAEGLAAIWNRIAAFRDHSLIRYAVPQPAAGTFPVELSLANNRDVKADTDVTISAVSPSITIDLPRESRAITVPDLEEPIDLRLSATASWLDGQERTLTAAALLVNGQQAAEIPVDDLASFVVPISTMAYGDNRLEIVATDSQGLQTTSPPVIITVTQGEQLAVPEELQPEGFNLSPWWLLLLLALVLGAIGWLLWRRRGATTTTTAPASSSSRRRRRTPAGSATSSPILTPAPSDGEALYVPSTASDQQPFVMAHLEVLDSQTYMPEEITLGDVEMRIGRSPAQSTIAFRDDITVSRYHAVLRLEGTRYRIYDAGSTSGTYVNSRQVPEYGLQLADGDEIQLGAVRLRYRQL